MILNQLKFGMTDLTKATKDFTMITCKMAKLELSHSTTILWNSNKIDLDKI